MNIYSLHTILLCVFDLYLILYTGGEWPAGLNSVYNIVEKSCLTGSAKALSHRTVAVALLS